MKTDYWELSCPVSEVVTPLTGEKSPRLGTLGPTATKETKLILLAGAQPLPPLLHPAWPLEDGWIANDG